MDTIDDPMLGTLVDARYRVRARVAHGGMATVYTAIDERLGRAVALKVIHPAQAQDPHFVERFSAEAQTIARLTHPNIVAVYDQGSYRGLPYLVMEYVKGQTLRELLISRGRLDPQDALAIMEQMLAAIAAAHRNGLVHRDVKPENVLVAEAPGGSTSLIDGVVKVTDFGLAQAVEASAVGDSQLMATAAYVAPELVSKGHADPRTDVYSAGIVLFELLTGSVPYEAANAVDVAWKHVQEDVPAPSSRLPGLPPLLDHLVLRATRRDPAVRPTDAGVMHAEIQSARDDLGTALAQASAAAAARQQTMMVSQLNPQSATTLLPNVNDPANTSFGGRHGAERPAWARLPEPRTGQAALGASGPREDTGRGFITGELGRHSSSGYNSSSKDTVGSLVTRVRSDQRARVATISVIAVLGVFLSIGIWWVGVGRYSTAPTLTGLAKDAAISQAEDAGFTIRFGTAVFDETIAKDAVVSQKPAAGDRVVSGSSIKLILSKGPEKYTVPDVSGKTYANAEQDLTTLKLTITRSEVYDDNTPAESVVSTDPAAGASVKPGDSITVNVSKGRAPITVPGVVGKTLSEAKSTLTKLGLVVATVQQDSSEPKDQVLNQDPVDGSGVESGTTVTLTISNGPPKVIVPDVCNMNAQDATTTLQALGLEVEVMGSGTVRVQNPSAQTEVEAGTKVTLIAIG